MGGIFTKKVLLLSTVFVLLFLRFNTFAAENGSEGNTSILGYKSILAETEDNNVLIGDVNGDNNVNSIDLVYMKKYILGLVDTFPAETGLYCADVGGNNQIDAIDLAYMKKYLLGMIKDFPKSTNNTDLSTPTPTPAVINKPTPEPLTGFITYYYVNGKNVRVNPGIEIFVEKSSKTPIKVSAATFCTGPLYADGWLRTYFRLGGNAVNGVDYEKIDFNYFWRPLGYGYGFGMNLGDDNPREEFSIIPIDTGTDETKDLEIYFEFSSEPAAIIHFVKSKE